MRKLNSGSNRSRIAESMPESPDISFMVRYVARWLLAGLFLLPGIATPLPSFGESRIEIDDPVWDIGTIPDGMDTRHAFVVRNSGDSDLHLLEIRPSCSSCLTAVAESSVVAPGQSGLVWCRFDPRSLQGPIAQDVRIESNDPRVPVCHLKVHAVVERRFEIPTVPFRIGVQSMDREVVVPIRRVGGSRPAGIRVRSTPDFVAASVVSVDDSLSLLTVRLVEPHPKGRQAIRVELGSVDLQDPGCLISGELYDPEPLEVVPSSLHFARGPGIQRRLLWIRQETSMPMELVGISVPVESVRCEVRPGARRGDYRLLVQGRFTQGVVAEPFELMIRFRDFHGSEHIWRVPITQGLSLSQASGAAGMELAN